MEYDLWRGEHFMENKLPWKTTLYGRQHSMKDDFRWNTTFDWGQLLMQDNLWWKITLQRRQHSMVDDHWCEKTVFPKWRLPKLTKSGPFCVTLVFENFYFSAVLKKKTGLITISVVMLLFFVSVQKEFSYGCNLKLNIIFQISHTK